MATFNGTAGNDTLTGTGDDDLLRGFGGADTLNGLAGNDTLVGHAGADILRGGQGDDTYVADKDDTFVEGLEGGSDTVQTRFAYILGDNLEDLVLTGSRDIRGTGNELANTLTGNSGDNLLDGLGGRDVVDYSTATAGIEVDLAITTAQAVAGHGSDTLRNIEGIIGSAFSDVLRGDAGDNVLNGGGGLDQMTGLGGDDTYVVDSQGDIVVEEEGGGIDTAVSTAANYRLAANVENGEIRTSGTASLRGNELDNTLIAGSGDNLITGGLGNDTVSYADHSTGGVTVTLASTAAQDTGGSGLDTLVDIENVIGSALADSLTGDDGANLLVGLSGEDSLFGGAGNDTLRGGENADRLRGGSGDDVFQYTQITDSGVLEPNMDVIFNLGTGDLIDLEAIDANGALAGDQAFTFIGDAAFSGTDAAGQLRFTYNAETDTGMLEGSVDADAAAEFAIALPGVNTLTAADLVL